jgi:hypothetical protein
LQFLAAGGEFYVSDEELLPYETADGVTLGRWQPSGGQSEIGPGTRSFFAWTDGAKVFYAPVFHRGDEPPPDVDGLKEQLAETVQSGQDIRFRVYATGPGLNVVSEIPDYDPAQDKRHIGRMLADFVQQGADRLVVVSDVWFRDQDGVATWDGVQIYESNRDGETAHLAPFEGKWSLGEWAGIRCPVGTLASTFGGALVSRKVVATPKALGVLGNDGAEQVASEIGELLSQATEFGPEQVSVAVFEYGGERLLAVVRRDDRPVRLTEIWGFEECFRVSGCLARLVLAQLTAEQRAEAMAESKERIRVTNHDDAYVFIVPPYEFVLFHRAGVKDQPGTDDPLDAE